MSNAFTASGLLELVHQYYPRNLHGDEEAFRKSEQQQRLSRARKEALDSYGAWGHLLELLRQELTDCRVQDWTVIRFSDDNCWRARVILPEILQLPDGEEFRTVVVLVSILAPIYVLYSSFQQHRRGEFSPSRLSYEDAPETKPWADKVEALVRSELQVHRIPNETIFTPVPDIQCGNVSLGEAHLVDCLFTDDRW